MPIQGDGRGEYIVAIDPIHEPLFKKYTLLKQPENDLQRRVASSAGRRPRRLTAKLRTVPASTYFVEIDTASCRVELFDAAFRLFFLARLQETLARHSAKLHAYSLLADRAVLLLSAPSRWPVERLIKQVQQTYLHYFNQRFRRRLRSTQSYSALCCVQGIELTRECYRFIERSPLIAGESICLGDTEWSSYPANAFGQAGSGLVRHACFDSIVPDKRGSLALYRDFISRPLDPLYARCLSEALHTQQRVDAHAMPAGLRATNE